MRPFIPATTVKLTSAITSSTVTIPNGFNSLMAYNAGANIVYLLYGATVAVPTVGTWTPGLIALIPGATKVFSNPPPGGTLAYIAENAGGTVILSMGEGA